MLITSKASSNIQRKAVRITRRSILQTSATGQALKQTLQLMSPNFGSIGEQPFWQHRQQLMFKFQRLQTVELWWGTACKLYCLQCKKAFSIIPACAVRQDLIHVVIRFRNLAFHFSYETSQKKLGNYIETHSRHPTPSEYWFTTFKNISPVATVMAKLVQKGAHNLVVLPPIMMV